MNRRHSLKLLAASAAAGSILGELAYAEATTSLATKVNARVVVVGGGFAGSTAARYLKALAPKLSVTLIDKRSTYVACPFSNLVIAGQRDISEQQFDRQTLAAEGIEFIADEVTGIDTTHQKVTLAGGGHRSYDRLVAAPGIDLRWNAIEGYDEKASLVLPHAWQAGAQTLLLQRQLQAMPDNGLVALSVPKNPYRCPPGPYERASLIASFLALHKPKAKLLILDAKDNFSKKALFQTGWRELYPQRIDWRGLSDSGQVNRVDPKRRELHTDFESVVADVINIIPPQTAGSIAVRSGLTDSTGWCPINPVNFASTLAPNVHIIGDAAIANAMPKSAFAANAQAKLCAMQIVRDLRGAAPLTTTLINTCYSLLAPNYGISVAGVYRPGKTALVPVPNTGGTSAMNAPANTRALEAAYARSWYSKVTKEAFG